MYVSIVGDSAVLNSQMRPIKSNEYTNSKYTQHKFYCRSTQLLCACHVIILWTKGSDYLSMNLYFKKVPNSKLFAFYLSMLYIIERLSDLSSFKTIVSHINVKAGKQEE